MSYREKYLKYKNKYLDLVKIKNQKGGWKCPVCGQTNGMFTLQCPGIIKKDTIIKGKPDDLIDSDFVGIGCWFKSGIVYVGKPIIPEYIIGLARSRKAQWDPFTSLLEDSGVNIPWDCTKCTFKSPYNINACNMCENPRLGYWKCPLCFLLNEDTNPSCKGCRTLNPKKSEYSSLARPNSQYHEAPAAAAAAVAAVVQPLQLVRFPEILQRIKLDHDLAELQREGIASISDCMVWSIGRFSERENEQPQEPVWHTLPNLQQMNDLRLQEILVPQYISEADFLARSIQENRIRLVKEYTKEAPAIGLLERAMLNYQEYKCKQALLHEMFIVFPILGDGDCFYRTTALLHYGTTAASGLVKLQVIAHLHQHRELFEQYGDDFGTQELQDRFLHKVIQPKEYAEGPIVEAFCDLYKCKIHNFSKLSVMPEGISPEVRNNGRDLDANNEGLPTICLFNYDGKKHFDAIYNLNSPILDEDCVHKYQENNTRVEWDRLRDIEREINGLVESNMWTCYGCPATFDGIMQNDLQSTHCIACDRPRPAAQAAAQAVASGKQKYFKLKNLALLYKK